MANWSQLVAYIRTNYHVAEQNDRMLRLHFPIGDDRTQVVFVWHARIQNGEDWVQIESPIGELEKIDLRALLELTANTVVGGAAVAAGYVVLRDALPLADMSVEEFETPFSCITTTADRFERELTGVDLF